MSKEDMRDYPQEIQDRIREVAYTMWESAGRQYGMAMEYWLAAEREVLKATQSAAERMMPTAKDVQNAMDAVSDPLASMGVKVETRTTTTKSSKPEPASEPSAEPATATPAQAAKPAPAAEPAPPPKTPEPAPAPATAKTAEPAKPTAAPAASSGTDLEQIEGLGPASKKKLNTNGIMTAADLLEACATPKGRKETSDKTGITQKNLLKWANVADLMRLSGVDGKLAELLEASGVDTVKELRVRRADNLAATMADVNAAKKLVSTPPSEAQISAWIGEAKTLDPKLTY